MRLALSLLAILCLQATSAQCACDPKARNARPLNQYALEGATAFDRKSGLTWQRCSVGQTWEDGKGCQGAVKGVTRLQAELLEQDGWRLPTIEELQMLVSPSCSRPSINETAFPGMDVRQLYYWSKSSPREAALYYLNFENGTVSADGDEEPYAVRLVRTGR